MKRTIAFLVVLCMLISVLPASVLAVEKSEAENTWEYAEFGTGIVLTDYHGTALDIYVPAMLDGKAVLKLGDSLFENNDAVNSVTLAEGITEIGAKAFFDADNLVCIVTPESLTCIGAQAFESCDRFNSVILYDAVTAIGENAFAGCPDLTVWCNEGTAGYTYATANNVAYEILNPDEMPWTINLDGARYYLSNGTALLMSIGAADRVIIPAFVNNYPVTQINSSVLSSLYNREVFLPNTITDIPEDLQVRQTTVVHFEEGSALQAYFDARELPYILVRDGAQPEEVTAGDYVFYVYEDFAALKAYIGTETAISVPSQVNGVPVKKVLPKAIWNECTKVITFPDCIDYMYSEAINCPVTTANIPTGVTRLPSNLFYGCPLLTDVKLHDGIKYIGDSALSYENNITSMVLPAGIEHIAQQAFRGTRFTEITYPVNARVDAAAFVNGYLEKVYVPKEVNNLNPEAFFQESYSSDEVSADLVFYVYSDSPALDVCKQYGLMYYCVDIGGEEPYEYYEDCVTYIVLPEYAVVKKAEGLETIAIPETVQGVPVTEICSYAFSPQYDVDAIVNVVLPDTITKIGVGAFAELNTLESVNIPEGIGKISSETFRECSSLRVVNIPETVSVIADSAFEGCAALKSIVLPNGLTSIGDSAFERCGIEEIVFPETLESIGDSAFDSSSIKTLTYPKVEIASWAFRDCDLLETVTVVDGVTELAYRVFEGCDNLIKVYVPDSVRTFHDRAFPRCPKVIVIGSDSGTSPVFQHARDHGRMYCTNWGANWLSTDECIQDGITYYLVNNMYNDYRYSATVISCDETVTGAVTIPETVTADGISYTVSRIGASAFAYKDITSIELPDTITVIDDLCLQCTDISQIDLPEELSYFGVNVFNATNIEEFTFPTGYDLNFGVFASTNALKNVIIPEGVKCIPEWAFNMCGNVENVVLPKSLERIEKEAFYNMWGNITEFTIPGGVTLEKDAIGGIATLRKVVFEEGITSLPRVLTSCGSLELVYLPRSLTYIDYEAFEGSPNLILCVYENSYAHEYAQKRGLPYFLLQKAENPEIAYGAGITGTAAYTDGTAAAGAAVEILYADGTLKESVVVDANGAYAFTYAEVGSYTIRVTDTNGNTASTQVSVKRMNAFDVFLAGDTGLTLKKSWSISGTVSASPATVTLTDGDGNLLASAETADGKFTLENIPNGTYVITAATENGSVSQEVTVFDGAVSDLVLTVAAQAATVWGYVEVEDRECNRHRRNWVQVSIYNEEGIIVAQTKSDSEGKYIFTNLPVGEYTIVAQTAEMRPDHKGKGYERSYRLTGYAYVRVTQAAAYQAEDIILYEENDCKVSISGKVTAHGETQNCEVILRNVFRHEVAKCTTGKNGKYTFKNIPDGLYIITATTESDGMGYTVVAVRRGDLYGDTDITVYKTDKLKERERSFHADLDDCLDENEARNRRTRIAEEKRFYDGLSEKEKKQLSKEYVRRLNELVEWAASCEYTADEGITVESGGLAISSAELENEEVVTFRIDVDKREKWETSTAGVKTREDFIQHEMEDAAGNRDIYEYYEITMTKTVDGEEQPITSVCKDTDTTGKFRVTMEIPEAHRGHKHYSFIHVHHGEPVELVDLDDDPNTITIEIDRFSTFALTYTDEQMVQPNHADVDVYLADGSEIWTESNADAISEHLNHAGSYVRVAVDGAAIEIPEGKTVYVDVNGKTVNITGKGTLYAMDSANDTFETSKGLAVVADTVNVVTDVTGGANGYRYIAVKEANGSYSFHRLDVKLKTVTLRPTAAGVYYKAIYNCDAVLSAKVRSYGVVLSLYNMPGADFMTEMLLGEKNRYTIAEQPFASGVVATSGSVFGIMKTGNTAQVNVLNGESKIYANAYLYLDGYGILVGDTANPGKTVNDADFNGIAYSLYDVLKAIDGNWSAYDVATQTRVKEFYNQWAQYGMNAWAESFTNIDA